MLLDHHLSKYLVGSKKVRCLHKFHKMALATPDLGLPNWEVLHVYQVSKIELYMNTVLLLRSTVSAGEPLAVGKIITLPRLQHQDDLNELEAMARLAEIPPHPNIIKLRSTHVDVPCPGEVSFILEYCAGEDLRSLMSHALFVQRYIPEGFVWHVLYQTLVALEYLHGYLIVHLDTHIGNLFLRPVDGDLYPDVVLGDFEYSVSLVQDELNARRDIRMLGRSFHQDILTTSADITDQTGDGAPPSQKLRTFVDELTGDLDSGLPSLRAEMQHWIALAKRMAYGNNNTSHQMPEWMIDYFVGLKRKSVPRQSDAEVQAPVGAESPKVNWDLDAESSTQAKGVSNSITAPGSWESQR